jgi:hypothetical protein
LGLGHISIGIIFVRVCIIRVVIGLMEKYHLDFRVMPYDLMFKNLIQIYQGLRFIF